jgi:[ribosomal protein S5]-alanine N-acetyltransferase
VPGEAAGTNRSRRMSSLRGTKVQLRPLVSADFPTVFSWFSDPQVVAPYDRFFSDSYEGFVRSMGQAGGDPASLAPRFGVEPVDRPGVVGVVGHYVSHPVLESIDVWYVIGERAARGKGFGREAVALLVDHLLATTSVERVAATCDVDNVASCRLVEGLGFRREGTLRSAFYHHGRWHDVHLYGVTRAEWSRPPSTT